MKIDLKGQVALVTGGTRGIGAATALMLAEAGAIVAVNYDKNERTARAFVEKLRKKKLTAFLAPGDVSDFLVADQIIRDVVSRTRKLDILVNNAGIWKSNPIDSPRAEEHWDRTLGVNLKSAFNLIVHAAPFLAKSKRGRIVNVSSTAGQRGEAGHSDYAASKGGMIALTKSMAVELASSQILVNCVAPGWVWTDMTVPTLKKPKVRKAILSQIPLGKIGQPEDIAGAILFLVSTLADHITGEVINVNGGSVLCG